MTLDARKRHWRNVLVDARYQVTFSLPMVLLSALLFVGLGYMAMERVDSATKIGLNQIEQTGSTYLDDVAQTKEMLLRREQQIRYGIIAGGVLLTLGLFVVGLRMTHRIAGPLHRLTLELVELQERFAEPRPSLRKRDQLVGLYDQFRAACMVLRQREEHEVKLWQKLVAAAEQDSVLRDMAELEQLRARLSAKEARLG